MVVVRETDSEIVVVREQLQAVVVQENRSNRCFLDGNFTTKKVVVVVDVRFESFQILSLVGNAWRTHLQVDSSFFVDCQVK